MKTSNLCMILFTALAIAACSKYNEFPEESSEDPNTGAPGRIYLYRYHDSPYYYDEGCFEPGHRSGHH